MIITQQSKIFEKPNIFYIKSVVIKNPKASHKYPRLKGFPNQVLPKLVIPLYIVKQKKKKIFEREECKNN